ncbi:MAG: radical SAM protein [Polyangiales bacterium]
MPRPIANPPNPFLESTLEWDGEPPPAELEVYEEDAKSALAKNDSPDLGFTWSLNPYRGCFHGCAYCLGGDTPILLGNGRVCALADLRVGQQIYGTELRGRYRYYVRTRVLALWQTTKQAFLITLRDGTRLVASGDHRFLTERGWKYVTGSHGGPDKRPHLTPNNRLMGVGQLARAPEEDSGYRRGYLCGLIRGDALLGSYDYSARRPGDKQYHFRLALADSSALWRARRYLREFDVGTHEIMFQPATQGRRAMHAIRTNARSSVQRIERLIAWPTRSEPSWIKGYLGGLFDAEGSYSDHTVRISNTDTAIIEHARDGFRALGFALATEHPKRASPMTVLRLRGPLRDKLRFFHTVRPAITRKTSIEGHALKNEKRLGIASIEPLGPQRLYDITTGTGDFIANGVVSHNCYARPSHQYWGFGAGTDFERRIVVKVNVPRKLREAFDKKSWKGETIVLSGNTDCYQPLEASYGLTRRCLETCLEYRNPVGVITKSKLVRRDVDVLAALAREARCCAVVSIPFADDEMGRRIEPYASSISKRFETLRVLSDAGIPTGVSLAPVIPGLNDGDMAAILERARDAGARSAFMTLVRLSGEVLPVFEQRLEEAFPQRAMKVRNAIREMRGGRMNDSRFGHRQRGQGERWRMIEQAFELHRRRLGLEPHRERAARGAATQSEREPEGTTFRRPRPQLSLFGDD